ncbi:hypothetical protein [Chryseobacterium scophthalmum]|uniref:hypothetical protein n=1 Tax=Chryseobacterium scophthalmum TaxID=59733 RepID=UPI001AEBAD05|nr:hypothetical protein [Chryseobacterium scophthalmum]
MKILFKSITVIVVILGLNFIINLIFVSKNNGKNHVDDYIKDSKEVKVRVNPNYFDGKIDVQNYFKYTIIFKGIYGKIDGFEFKDDLTGKYFKIIRFDKYGVDYGLPQSTKLDEEELYVKIDPLQINNPSFGTKENPILVFSYKGVNQQLTTDIRTDEIGKDGFYINKEVQLSPTEEEYRYNVEQYLTYEMPKEEFKKRFK